MAHANPELDAVFMPEANSALGPRPSALGPRPSALGAAQAAKELGGNGLAVVTAKNADSFYWDACLKRRGTKGIEE